MIKGGPDGTCISDDRSEWFLQEKGRPCPRVELDPLLSPETELLACLMHTDLKHLAKAQYDALVDGLELDAEERLNLLRRVRSVLSDEDVVALLHPAPEIPEE